MSIELWPTRPTTPQPLPRPPDWTQLARCAEVGDDLWFPEKGASVTDPKRVCRGCEVRAECLEYAIDHNELFGIWGGLTARERRHIKRQALAA